MLNEQERTTVIRHEMIGVQDGLFILDEDGFEEFMYMLSQYVDMTIERGGLENPE